MPYKLKFELSLFDEMLLSEFHPDNIEKTLKRTALDALKTAIDTEAVRACREIRNATCRNIEDSILERNIRMHCREIIRMLDMVFHYLNPQGGTDHSALIMREDCVSAYRLLEGGLTFILSYIERDLNRYFDRLLQSVPERVRQASALEMLADRNILWAKLKAKQVDEQLRELILNHIGEHCAKSSASYHEQDYNWRLMNRLLLVLKGDRGGDWSLRVVTELIGLNFNKRSFFAWCRRFIAREVDSYSDSRVQMGRFSWYLKEIKQIAGEPDFCYRAGRPGIKKLLNSYIGVELMYLSEWHKDNPAAAVKDLKERAERFDYKLPLNLTVEQLGLFVELFIRLNIFPVEKGKMMMTMEFFAENVSTVGTSNISAVSLNNKRRPDSRTIAWMRDKVRGIEGLLGVMEGE